MSYGTQLLLLFLSLLPQHHRGIFTPASGLSITQTNGASAVPSTGNVTVALTSVAAGDEIVVGCGVNNGKTCTASDTLSQTYTQDSTVSGGTNVVYIFHFTNSASGADTITCHDSSTFSDVSCFVLQLHGALTSGSFDVQNSSTFASTTTPSSATTATTAAAHECVVALFGLSNGSNSVTAGTGYTLFINGSQGTTNRSAGMMYKLVTSTGTQQATATLGSAAGGSDAIATYD